MVAILTKDVVAVQVNANAPAGTIRGIAMLNCAAGMNNKVGFAQQRLKDTSPVPKSLWCCKVEHV